MVPSFFAFFLCAPNSCSSDKKTNRAEVPSFIFLFRGLERFLSLAAFLPLQIMSRVIVVISSVLTDSFVTRDAPSASNHCTPPKSLLRALSVSLTCGLSPSISLSPNSLAKSPRLGTLQCHTFHLDPFTDIQSYTTFV